MNKPTKTLRTNLKALKAEGVRVCGVDCPVTVDGFADLSSAELERSAHA